MKKLKKLVSILLATALMASTVPYNFPVIYGEENGIISAADTSNESTITDSNSEIPVQPDFKPASVENTLSEANPSGEDTATSPAASPEDANSTTSENEPDLAENINNVNVDNKFLFNRETKTIVRYLGKEPNVEIPSTLSYEGTTYAIEHIGNFAFSVNVNENENIKINSVVLPEGLLSIGEAAFKGQNIQILELPASLKKISNRAFMGNNINQLTLKDGNQLIEIGESAFKNNEISNLDLSKAIKLTTIGRESFKNNEIETLKLADNDVLTTIGDKAFSTNKLSKVTLPNSIVAYGDDVFGNNEQFVIVQTQSETVNNQVSSESFGSIKNPVSFYVKGIDAQGNEILSVRKIENKFDQQLSLSDILAIGNNVRIQGPAIPGYLSDELVKEPLDEEFVRTHTKDNPYVFNYRRNEDKPVLKGLSPLIVDVAQSIDFLAGVSAETADGQAISSNKIKFTPNKIDTSYEAIHKVTYSVVDESGNKATGVRTIIVGRDIMQLETGKGWIMADFTYDNNRVTGFSESGLEKLKVNREVVLPTFNPTDIEDLKPITEIGESAFIDKELLSVVLPDNITTIKSSAFKGNKLATVSLPDTLVAIEREAFNNNNLSSINFPEDLNSIGEGAFSDNKLSSVAIPAKVTNIESDVFKNNKLITVAFHENVTSIGSNAFLNNRITSLELPNKLTTIGSNAFSTNKLSSITIPDSVIEVGDYAFAKNRLTSFEVSKSMTTLAEGIFSDNKLNKFVLPENITSIGANAFLRNNFVNVTIPSHITTIGDYAFSENYLLKNIEFNEGLTSIGAYAFYKVDLAMEELVFPDSLRTIGSYAFSGAGTTSKIKKIKFNEGLDTINSSAFSELTLSEVTTKGENEEVGKLPDSLTVLGSYAFFKNNLKSLILPENITVVPEYLAYENNLQNLKLSSSTTVIGPYAFQNNNLNELDLAKMTPVLERISSSAFKYNDKLRKVVFPDTLTTIESEAFYYNNLLSEVKFGSGLKSIGSYAFESNSLTNIELPDGLTNIDYRAFYGNFLTSLSLPDSVTNIGSSAFSYNKIKSLKLSANLENIGSEVFRNNKLSELTIPANVRTVDSNAFADNSIISINVEDGSKLSTINSYAFYQNQLSKVVLPASVTNIAQDAFSNNPGDVNSPSIVLVYIKNGDVFSPTTIQNSPSMMVNMSPITVLSLEQGTDRYVKSPEVTFKRIGETASFVGEANKYYQPASSVATEVLVSDRPETVSLYYVKKAEYNPKNIQLDMQFTNYQKELLGYGLKDDNNTYDGYGPYNEFIITLKITDESVLNGENPYLDIDFNNPNPGDYLSNMAGNIYYSNLNSDSSPLKLDANYREFFSNAKFINENSNSSKLRLFFKPGVLRPNQSINIGFRYRGYYLAPNNSIVDFSGAVSFGTEESSTPLATTNPDNRIGIRHVRPLPSIIKDGPTRASYVGENYAVDHQGNKYASNLLEPSIEYVLSLQKASEIFPQYDYKKMKVIDTLPTYPKLTEDGQVVTAYALLDEAKSLHWRYVDGSDKQKVEFTGVDVREISKYPLHLKFPGIRDSYQVTNSAVLEGNLGTNKNKILNGTLEEATEKFNLPSPNYENEIPHRDGASSSSSLSTTLYFNDSYDRDTREKSTNSKTLGIYKRTQSFFNAYASNLFPEYQPENYEWYYNGSRYSYYSLGYNYAPSNASDSNYYFSYFPNTEKYRSLPIDYVIEIIYGYGNAKNLVYKDTNLNENLKYKKLKIPEEIKSAVLKLYDNDSATGEPFFEKVIYNDEYVLTKEQQERAKSYSLEFNGELEGTPFTVNRAKMSNTVEFRDPTKNIEINNAFSTTYDSTANISGTVYYESLGETTISNQTYTEKFQITNGQDVFSSFVKSRVKPGCPDPLNHNESSEECELFNSDSNELSTGKRISFNYTMGVSGFLNGVYHDFLLYDKLPKGLDYIKFTPSEEFIELIKGYQEDVTTDEEGRFIIKISATELKLREGASEKPVNKEIVIGKLDAVANATITNGNFNNTAYLGIPNLEAINNNQKNNLNTKNDKNLVEAFSDAKYRSVLEGIAPYRATISAGVVGELKEKLENSNVWTPFVVKVDESGNYEYKISMINQKNNPENSYTTYAVLPYHEDINVVTNQDGEFLPRGTHIRGVQDDGTEVIGKISLRGPITISDPNKTDEGDDAYYEVFYTFENRTNLKNEFADNLVNNNDLWLTKEQVNNQWDKVTAFKIVSKKPFAANSVDEYILPMKAPDNPDYLFDNLPFSEEFIKEHGLDLNKIVFKFSSAPNPVGNLEGENRHRRSLFVAGNRVEAYLESPKAKIEITKKGYQTNSEKPQAITESEEAFLERLPALKGATFELYMVGKENVDPESALSTTEELFSELRGIKERDKLKDINKILSKKVFKEPIRTLVNGEYRTKITSDEAGKLIFSNLFKNREYILREVEEPEGYLTNVFEKLVYIDKNMFLEAENTANPNEEVVVRKKILNTTPLSMEIKPIRASISFNKTDINNNPLPFTRFRLVKINENDVETPEVYNKTASTNDSGFLRFDDMPLGKYKLIEVGPRGSLEAIEPIIFYAKKTYADTDLILEDKDIADYHYDLVFKNPIVNNKAKLDVYKLGIYDVALQEKINEGKLTILKKTSGKPLENVTLRISSEDQSFQVEKVTDQTGLASFTGLEINKNYLLTEVAKPEDFSEFTKTYKVRINELGIIFINDEQNNFEYTVFPNIPKENTNRIDIKKVDDSGNELPLANAKFTLYEVSETNELTEVDTKTTDEKGELTFKEFGIDQGRAPIAKKYLLKEVEPPLGYIVRDGEFEFSTNENTFTYLIKTIENPKIELIVNKTIKDLAEPLQGAEFTLYEVTENGTLEAVRDELQAEVKAVSDNNGIAKFNYDKFDVKKSYAVRETKAPEGYNRNNKIYNFDLKGLAKTVTFNGVFEIDVENEPQKGRLIINKFDEVTKTPLEGVLFELKNEAINYKEEARTKDDGSLTFKDLEIGTYTLTEKEGVVGYALPASPIEISITKTNLSIKKAIPNRRLAKNFKLKKTSEKGHLLKNARFSIEKSIAGDYFFTQPIYVETNEQGLTTLSNLEVGYVYRLREMNPLDGKKIEPNTDIGAIKGYQISEKTWFLTAKADKNGEIKLYQREAGQTVEKEVENDELVIENKRILPDKVLISINKTLNGGQNLNPMPEFRVRLKRGTNNNNLVVLPDSEVSLVKQENGTFQYTYRDLDFDVWDEATNKWIPYIYDVEELDVENFTPTINKNEEDSTSNHLRFNIVNTYASPTISVKGKKVWVNGGENNPQTYLAVFRKIDTEQTFSLVSDSIREIVAGNKSESEFVWENLPQTDANGNVYQYKVDETNSEGSVVDKVDNFIKELTFDENEKQFVVTNTYNSPTEKFVIVKKNWVNGPSTKPTVYFRLYRKTIDDNDFIPLSNDDMPTKPNSNDKQSAIKELTSGSTQISFTNLPNTNAQAKEFIYTVKETDEQGNLLNLGAMYADENNEATYKNIIYSYAEPSYNDEAEANTVIVTNTFTIPKTEVKAKKEWVDGPSPRPTVWITLYRKVNQTEIGERVPGDEYTREISTPEGQQAVEVTFENLDLTNQQGQSYIYYVVETDANGQKNIPENYINDENSKDRDLLKIINTYTPPRATISFKKIWQNGQYFRPEVSFKLYRKVKNKENAPMELVPKVEPYVLPVISKDELETKNEQDFSFTDIETHNKAGEEYEFSVEEIAQPAKDQDPGTYETTISEDKRTITNTYKTKPTKLTLTKIWENISSNRPEVYFKLYRVLDETILQSLGVDIENNEEEVVLYKDNFVDDLLAEELALLNENEILPNGNSDLYSKVHIPKKNKEKTITIELQNLPYSSPNAIPYRYFIREYDKKTEKEFKNTNYRVKYLPDGLSVKNTFNPPGNPPTVPLWEYVEKVIIGNENPDPNENTSSKIPNSNEEPKKEKHNKVVPTATKDTIFIYYILGITSLLGIIILLFTTKKNRKND